MTNPDSFERQVAVAFHRGAALAQEAMSLVHLIRYITTGKHPGPRPSYGPLTKEDMLRLEARATALQVLLMEAGVWREPGVPMAWGESLVPAAMVPRELRWDGIIQPGMQFVWHHDSGSTDVVEVTDIAGKTIWMRVLTQAGDNRPLREVYSDEENFRLKAVHILGTGP